MWSVTLLLLAVDHVEYEASTACSASELTGNGRNRGVCRREGVIFTSSLRHHLQMLSNRPSIIYET